MKYSLVALWFLGLLLLLAAPSARSATYAPEKVRQDLKFLYDTLQASHCDLFAHVPKADCDREFQRLDESIKQEMDDVTVYRVLQSFLARCRFQNAQLLRSRRDLVAHLCVLRDFA